ncbi:MAG TPA: AAA family ATPase [Actinocrinis sp.]|jgi:energy-coupling factor transporter ATP-binding protein EcfA2|uniref:nSTAND1 domain-containing NTPase n=1 Tax=Actinocrinis sp. TaxID=1920516 RepID=UPI002DDCC1D0|nr:AAA family ATPase [Actinocrinis sp.]HEV3172952.1 AAA family ATPase [Actinocrinis sp.]
MPRPERPIDGGEDALTQFALDLRELRAGAGNPGYRELARRAYYSASTLSEAAAGRRLPSLEVTLAYVRACDGDPVVWEERWRRLATELVPQEVDTDVAASPYLGLSTFGPQDAQWFFGRERQVRELLRRLTERRFLAVFGPSGSGKSSLLRAGLLSAAANGGLDGEAEPVHVLFTPGAHPLQECAVQLAGMLGVTAGALHADLAADPGRLDLAIRQLLADRSTASEVLLVVDQFEEVFTLCEDAGERRAFVAALLTAARSPASRVRIVVGIRADFYGRCAELPDLVEAMQDAQILVGSMTAQELHAAITQPALHAGLTVETTVVSTIVTEMIGRPGALPLMSHALLETWLRRRGNTLTLAGYQAAGGIDGALARSAERAFTALDAEQQRAARHVLLRLIALGDGAEDTRRRLTRGELDENAAASVVVHELAQARLLTLGDDTVELTHEALIRSWPRLRAWLDEDRDGLRLHQQLIGAAATWDTEHRDPGLLYRGNRLSAAQEW